MVVFTLSICLPTSSAERNGARFLTERDSDDYSSIATETTNREEKTETDTREESKDG